MSNNMVIRKADRVLVSTEYAVEAAQQRWPFATNVVKNMDDQGNSLNTVSLVQDGTNVELLADIPQYVESMPGSYVEDSVLIAEFQCKHCGSVCNSLRVCDCGTRKEDFTVVTTSLDVAEFLHWWMLRPANRGNGVIADAVYTVARPTKRRKLERTRVEGGEMFWRELQLAALGQVAFPEGDGAKHLRDAGVNIGRIRVFSDVAPWFHRSIISESDGRLHAAERKLASIEEVGRSVRKHRLSPAGTSNGKPGNVFYRVGKKAPNIIEKVYAFPYYTKPSRFNSMITAAMNAVAPFTKLPEATWAPSVVRPAGGADVPGQNLLTLWIRHPINRCDTVGMTIRALSNFWFIQKQHIRVPKNSVLFFIEDSFVEDHITIAMTSGGRKISWSSTEFHPNIQHDVRLVSGKYHEVDGIYYSDSVVVFEITTERVAAEGSKFSSNGNKCSAVRFNDNLVAQFGPEGFEEDIAVVSAPDRMETGACFGSYLETIASVIPMLRGEEFIEIPLDETEESIKAKALDALRNSEFGSIVLPHGKTLVEYWEEDQMNIGYFPIYKEERIADGEDEITVEREFYCMGLVGMNRWLLQPQHPEVTSAFSHSRTSAPSLFNDDGTLSRKSDASRTGAKVLGWEMTSIKQLAPSVADEFLQYEDTATKTLAILLAECLTLKPHDGLLKSIDYRGDFGGVLDDTDEDIQDEMVEGEQE